MVKTVDLINDNEHGGVFLNGKLLDYDALYQITIDIVDNSTTYEFNFKNFEDLPDLKAYYEEIFKSISSLANDPEIIDLNQKLSSSDLK